jgi:aldehyde:ferredoxin oxidoreductase
MRYGETGVTLEVDLSTGEVKKYESDPSWTELYLGGLGTNLRYLWEKAPLDCHPFSPENVIIFGAGLLVGTPVVGATRTVVTSYVPVNNLVAFSMIGGHFGAELKFAGYDRIVVKGRASEPVYLWIDNDKVEIRSAKHLWGKGILETFRVIREELKEPRAQIAAIGPAGENRVYFAAIQHAWHTAGRGGLGAIMGDKKLKAIAVRGTKDLRTAKPQELFELCFRMREEIRKNPNLGDWMAYTDNDAFHHDNFAWGYARVRRKGYWTPEVEERFARIRKEHQLRVVGCFNCPKECEIVIKYPGKPIFGYKCFAKDTFHMAAFQGLDFSYEFLPLVVDYGVDAYSMPQVIAFAIELYENGILTDQDLPGFPKDVKGRFYYLFEKIVKREGIGDILAEGTWWAAQKIGRGAEKIEHNSIKKVEQVPIKLGKLNPIYFLWWSTNEKWNITQIEGTWPQDPIPDPEKRKAFVESWIAPPNEEFKKWFLEWEKREIISVERACAIADWSERMHYIDNSTGLCGFLSAFRGQFGGIPGPDQLVGAGPAYHIHNIPYLISLATGIEYDEEKLWETAGRIRTLIRAMNNIRGLRREDERPPEDHWAVRDPELEKRLLDEYYKFKGWNEEGIPTKETLLKYGLDFVIPEFERRNLL